MSIVTRSAVLVILAIGILGCSITEPPGPPSTGTTFGTTLTLTHDQPVAITSLAYSGRAGDQAVSGITGYIEVVGQGGGGPGSETHPDVWVSLLNVETGASTDAIGGIGHASVDGWGHNARCDGASVFDVEGVYATAAVPPCDGRWTVIARWLEPEPGVEIPLEVNASMTANARDRPAAGEPTGLDAVLAITESGPPAGATGPAVTRAGAGGSARLSASTPRETHRFVLRVPAALLDGEAGFPRLGRLFFGVHVTDWSGAPSYLRTEVSIDGEVVGGATGPSAPARDWLARCPQGIDCELPVAITIEPASSSQVATYPPDGFIAIDWVLEARYEDFSADAVLPASLELVEAP
jgi:hypothetical protein